MANLITSYLGRGAAPMARKENTAEIQIRELARKYSISPARTGLDEWADDVSRLSDADVALDEIERMLVVLERDELITGIEAMQLHAEYLKQKAA